MSASAAVLRSRLEQGGIVTLPGAFNALSARLIEEAGFEAVYASGAGISNAYLAAPDLGLLTPDEFFGNLRAIVDATTIPVVADLDTGHGGVHNVGRAIRDAERAGAAAVQIEDQVFPKRCGHFAGKELVSPSEMAAKITVACESRRDAATVVIARTDAVAPEGFEAAIERGLLYRDAGADVIFIEALENAQQIRAAAAAIDGPKLINMVEGGITPLMPIEELEGLGYQFALFANYALRAAMKALGSALGELHKKGSSADLQASIVGWDERQRIVRLHEFQAREERWTTAGDRLAATRTSSHS